jgi:hypothetical protein
MIHFSLNRKLMFFLYLCIIMPLFSQTINAQAKVILYEKDNFGGKQLVLTANTADVTVSPYFYGQIASSIKLEGVSSVAVFDRVNFQGNCQAFTGNVASLKNTFIGNDSILSLKLNASCDTGPAVILYEKKNFGGKKLKVSGDVPSLTGEKYKFNDDADSIQLSDGAVSVAIYENEGYVGNCTTLTADTPDLDKTNVGRNRLTSLKVNQRCGEATRGVYLFEDTNYEGKSLTLTENAASLKGLNFNDKTSSIKLVQISSIAVFENENWEGKCETIKADTPSLKGSEVGNDKISSIKVNAECDKLRTLIIKNHAAAVIKYSWSYYDQIWGWQEKRLASGQSDTIFLDPNKKLFLYVDVIDIDLKAKTKCRYEPLVSDTDIVITAKGALPNVSCDLEHKY